MNCCFGERIFDGVRFANISIVYHDSVLGQIELFVDEAYTHKVLNIGCCEQKAESLEDGVRDDSSVVNTRQRVVDGRGTGLGREQVY